MPATTSPGRRERGNIRQIDGNVESDTQIEKFRDLARELECDDSEEAFDEALKRIAKVPKPPTPGDTE